MFGTKGIWQVPWGLVKKKKKAKHSAIELLCALDVVSMKIAP